MKKVLLLLLLSFSTIMLHALPTCNIKNIGLREGLSNGFVVDIAIDGKGFVWAATEHGLSRIAGNKTTVFTTDNSDISNNEHVGLLYHAKTQTLWIHSKDGRVDIYNCRTQQISHYIDAKGNNMVSVADIAMAADSALWLAHYDGSITHYDPVTKKSYEISKLRFPQIKNGVRSIMDDGNGNLYIGLRMDGLIVYNIRTQRSRFYCNRPGDSNSLPGNNVRSVFVDHLQNIWVGTNMGLALFDQMKGTFRVFKHITTDSGSLAGDNIQQIMETKDHMLWIASDIGGISKLNLNLYTHPYYGSVVFQQMTRDNAGLSSNNIRRMQEDAYGNMWIANYSTGVDFIPSFGSPFQTLMSDDKAITNISALYIDHNDNLWIGEDNKVTMYHEGEIVHTYDFSGCLNNSSSSVYLFCEDHQGNIWFGTTDNGVIKLNPATGKLSTVACTKNLDVNALYVDNADKLWIGSEDGVFSVQEGIERKENKINGIIGQSSIPFSIVSDNKGNLWIGTLARGIFVFNKQQQLIAHLGERDSFPSSSINQLIKDEDGGIWAATHNGLVYIPDVTQPNRYNVYDEKNGISESQIRALVQDRQGDIWVSTFSGIACFEQGKQRFYNFDYQSGIPMGNFSVAAAAVSSTGLVYFGSPSGICCFNPQIIQQQEAVSPVEIIGCEQLISQASKIKKLIIPADNEGQSILRYDENTFKVAFTVKNYAQDGIVEYSYKMKGLDDEWYSTNGDNEVIFRNLDPGTYTFTVRAKLKNQDWKQASVAEMQITVQPPFWLTWWAKLFYIAVGIGIVYVILCSYKKQMKLRNSLEKTRWESQQKQELNEERLRFFTNITHELRTPLTLIIGPLEDLLADSRLPEVLQRKVKSIHASSERLLNLINEILEFRKTETQNRRLSVAKSDLSTVVKEIGTRFRDLNHNPNVEIVVTVPNQKIEVYFDSEVINTVISNLMSNAMKYTPKGIIQLDLQLKDGWCNICVSDTGYGISKTALPHIYDRYYQAKGMHQASGTGIGLALVKSLAQLHEAQLFVDSVEGKGSKFTFALKIDNTYPHALHKDDEKQTVDRQLKAGVTGSSMESEVKDVRPLILVVEDNDDIRQYIQESLDEDYRIIQARNGKQGCDMAFEQTPDLIVSDIMMPEMDGIEMIKLLKSDVRTSHIPIVILTAKTSSADQETGYDSGADSYLMKPFSAHLLHSRIRNILSARRRLAELILNKNTAVDADAAAADNTEDAVVIVNNEDANDNAPAATTHLSDLDRKFLDKLDAIIRENISTEDLDIAFMTDKFAMSHSTFYRKVKALTGLSANEYMRKLKLQHSMRLLQSGQYNVNEVAMMTGFNNIGYFRRSFKKEYGITPSEVLKTKQ